jgi:hypothetical protein
MTLEEKRNFENPVQQEMSLSQGEQQREKPYDQKLRAMSTPELIQELATMKWHYALFQDKKKFDMVCAIEMEIARRKGRLEPSINNGTKR